MRITGAILAQAVCLACIFVICPQVTAADASAKQSFVDVKLDEGGKMMGRIVDQQGQPIAHTHVELRQANGVVTTARTKKNGWFEVRGLRGGKYVLASNNQVGLVRAWTADTAPPAANQAIQLVTSDQVVRGNFDDPDARAAAAIGGGALLIGILSINKPGSSSSPSS
jgi:hypothetical protein